MYVLLAVSVDGPAPSCTEGEYLPRFLHPTPHNGEHLQTRVNQELEIRIKAFASLSRFLVQEYYKIFILILLEKSLKGED